MARHTIDVTVDDVKYSITHYDTTKGIDLMEELIQVIGEPFGYVAGAGGIDANLSGELIGKVCASLALGLGKKSTSGLIKKLLFGVRVESGDARGELLPMFDVHFAGRIGSVVLLLKEVLTHQYGDFFRVLGVSVGGETTQA